MLFWLGIWCESLVWVIMGRRGVSQNAGVLVVLVVYWKTCYILGCVINMPDNTATKNRVVMVPALLSLVALQVVIMNSGAIWGWNNEQFRLSGAHPSSADNLVWYMYILKMKIWMFYFKMMWLSLYCRLPLLAMTHRFHQSVHVMVCCQIWQ